MGLYEQIVAVYPELTPEDFNPTGVIHLQDDSDGVGPYIVKWDYDKPLPAGMKVGKN